MREGLYKVHFRTPVGEGAGVVVLHQGRVVGGDSGMYYVGTYSESGEQFTAEVRIDRHTQWGAGSSVFGVNRATIHLSGKSSGDAGQVTGRADEAPGVSFQASFSRLCDL